APLQLPAASDRCSPIGSAPPGRFWRLSASSPPPSCSSPTCSPRFATPTWGSSSSCSRRRRRPGAVPLPRIDLNDPAQRRAAVVALVIAALLLFVTAVGSYQAYDYSESVAFCGQV